MAMAGLTAVALKVGAPAAPAILLAGMGASLGGLLFNWYPARIFVGDAGTLSLGAVLAASSVAGNFEMAGVIVIVPYALDFVIKAAHGFPSRGWSGKLGEDGKLRCPENGPVGLGQAILKLTGGLREPGLTLVLVGLEAIFAALAALLYYLR